MSKYHGICLLVVLWALQKSAKTEQPYAYWDLEHQIDGELSGKGGKRESQSSFKGRNSGVSAEKANFIRYELLLNSFPPQLPSAVRMSHRKLKIHRDGQRVRSYMADVSFNVAHVN